jgi:hypothetical protein
MPIKRQNVENVADAIVKQINSHTFIVQLVYSLTSISSDLHEIGKWPSFSTSEGGLNDVWIYCPLTCDVQSLILEVKRYLEEDCDLTVKLIQE